MPKGICICGGKKNSKHVSASLCVMSISSNHLCKTHQEVQLEVQQDVQLTTSRCCKPRTKIRLARGLRAPSGAHGTSRGCQSTSEALRSGTPRSEHEQARGVSWESTRFNRGSTEVQ